MAFSSVMSADVISPFAVIGPDGAIGLGGCAEVISLAGDVAATHVAGHAENGLSALGR